MNVIFSESKPTPVPDDICLRPGFSRKQGLQADSLFGEVIVGNRSRGTGRVKQGRRESQYKSVFVGWPSLPATRLCTAGSFQGAVELHLQVVWKKGEGSIIHQHPSPTGHGITSSHFHSATV